MNKYYFISVFLLLIVKVHSQNTISIRKTDTSFNSIFYSEKIFKNKSYTSLKGTEKHNKKARMYYVYGKEGDIWFFTETHRLNKVIKSTQDIDWTKIPQTGRYFITNNELAIYPYHRSITGKLVLNEVFFDGTYNKTTIRINQNGIRKKLLFLTDY